MARKLRFDSPKSQAKTFADTAKGELMPPSHISMPEPAIPFWRAIVEARAREDWESTPALMNAAANLAWAQWQIDMMKRIINGEEVVPTGSSIAQTASSVLKLQRLEMSYLKILQQHGRAADGELRDVVKRRQAQKDTAKFANAIEEDDLLARPSLQ